MRILEVVKRWIIGTAMLCIMANCEVARRVYVITAVQTQHQKLCPFLYGINHFLSRCSISKINVQPRDGKGTQCAIARLFSLDDRHDVTPVERHLCLPSIDLAHVLHSGSNCGGSEVIYFLRPCPINELLAIPIYI